MIGPNLQYVRAVLLLATAAIAAGCGGSDAQQVTSRKDAQVAADKAAAAVVSGDQAAIIAEANTALGAGGLNPDQADELLLKRAKAYADSSQFDKAIADLDQILQGGVSIQEAGQLKAQILEKQGKSAEAAAVLQSVAEKESPTGAAVAPAQSNDDR